MNAFIKKNKNTDAMIAAGNAGCESYDHTAVVLQGHMTQLPFILQYAGRGIERAQL